VVRKVGLPPLSWQHSAYALHKKCFTLSEPRRVGVATGLRLKEALDQVTAGLRFQNPRSGRKHKAWGGAERNPRMVRETGVSPRSGRQQLPRVHRSFCAIARFARSVFLPSLSWGSAPLHSRLYAFAALRGLIAILQRLDQSFLNLTGPMTIRVNLWPVATAPGSDRRHADRLSTFCAKTSVYPSSLYAPTASERRRSSQFQARS
jgi:hypothetical protein